MAQQATPTIYRQGDVLFRLIDSLPDEPLAVRETSVIVEGEVTGHAHRLLEGRILETAQDELFLDILQATQVVHEEHHAIDLKPGCYQVFRQREYTPEAIRTVID